MSDADIPQAATDRLSRKTFTSDLSVDELISLDAVGIRPLGLVLGVAVWRAGDQRTNPSIIMMNQAMTNLRRLAMQRMEAEARRLGADGIVGVDLDLRHDKPQRGLLEMVMTGTAIITEEAASTLRLPAGQLFSTMLPAQDLWKLHRIGYRPVRMCVGYSANYVLLMRSQPQSFSSAGNVEMTNYTKTVGKARSLAMDQLESEARGAGANGIIGVKLSLLGRGEASRFVECLATGTAVIRRGHPRRLPNPEPVLHLSR